MNFKQSKLKANYEYQKPTQQENISCATYIYPTYYDQNVVFWSNVVYTTLDLSY